jgi:hypothetical protein
LVTSQRYDTYFDTSLTMKKNRHVYSEALSCMSPSIAQEGKCNNKSELCLRSAKVDNPINTLTHSNNNLLYLSDLCWRCSSFQSGVEPGMYFESSAPTVDNM